MDSMLWAHLLYFVRCAWRKIIALRHPVMQSHHILHHSHDAFNGIDFWYWLKFIINWIFFLPTRKFAVAFQSYIKIVLLVLGINWLIGFSDPSLSLFLVRKREKNNVYQFVQHTTDLLIDIMTLLHNRYLSIWYIDDGVWENWELLLVFERYVTWW